MPRASYQRKTCKDCGGHRDEVGHVTWRGYCIVCGTERHETEVREMHAHAGPYFEHWRRQMAASVGASLLDELETKA